jgi:hypothetical protein
VAEAYTTQPSKETASRVLYVYLACMAGWPLGEQRDAHIWAPHACAVMPWGGGVLYFKLGVGRCSYDASTLSIFFTIAGFRADYECRLIMCYTRTEISFSLCRSLSCSLARCVSTSTLVADTQTTRSVGPSIWPDFRILLLHPGPWTRYTDRKLLFPIRSLSWTLFSFYSKPMRLF